ncbi:helix-turn-helix domain-containing protein [Streptomyces sp. NPDC090025]|uniref:helix-turn-helix domain-containing protein n=1 Tax=Streptomyces sp. NPDC090025 TaxID=3365922 RepID=UPI003839AF6C
MSMVERFYTVEQVAELLDLHVKTVRGYVRDGRLPATRVGRQYRIAAADLEAFTATPAVLPAASAPAPAAAPTVRAPRADASTVVQIDGVDRHTADRIANAIMATQLGRHERERGGAGAGAGAEGAFGFGSGAGPGAGSGSVGASGSRLRVEAVFDPDRDALKFVILGDLDLTADLLKVLDAMIGGMK